MMEDFLTRRELMRRMGVLASGCGAGVGAIQRASAQAQQQWPQFGRDQANTGQALENGPDSPVSEQWAFRTSGGVSSSPAVVDDTTYVGSADGSVYALSTADGSERWVHEMGNGVGSSPAVVDGTVYVGSLDGSVYALSAADGTELWTTGTDDGIVSSPAVVDGTVYIGSRDESLYALSATDGTEQWSYATGGEIWSSPAVVDGTVYVGSRSGMLHAVSTADGSERWTYETGDWVESPPAVNDGTVYVGSLDSSVYALSTTDGSERWVYTADGGIASSPAIADGTVYIGSEDGRVYSVSAVDGAERWRFNTGGGVFSSPAVAGGTVCVGSRDGSVYALSATGGTEQWSYATDGPVFSSPAIVEKTVYVGSADDRVYALAQRSPSSSPTVLTRSPTEGGEAGGPDVQENIGSATPGGLLSVSTSTDGLPLLELVVTLVGGAVAGGSGLWWFRGRRAESDGPDEGAAGGQTSTERSTTGTVSEQEAASTNGTSESRGGAPVSASTTRSDEESLLAVPKTVIERNTPKTSPETDSVPISYDALLNHEELHAAGSGRIIKATPHAADSNRPVAVKQPRGTGTIQRPHIDELIQGAEIWAKIDGHEHVVGVRGYDANPLPWVAMEYMDGGNLSERAEGLDFSQSFWTALAITKAIHYAHRQGVTHLGLTPRDILFRETATDMWDWPKVSDWGISGLISARADDDSSTYAAPEQVKSTLGPVDHVTDIYRVAAICYELFTGRPPFETSPDSEGFRRRPQPPSTVADVPPALDTVLQPALAWDREERYDSIVYLRDKLKDRLLDS